MLISVVLNLLEENMLLINPISVVDISQTWILSNLNANRI